MASASDVRDILSLPHPSSGPSQPKKLVPGTSRKPEGISRELYSLIGDKAPTLVPQFTRPKFKQKPVFGKGKVKWEWKSFSNPARADSLRLSHWESDNVKDASYRFAQYNVEPPVYTYTAEEYTRYLEDPDWSKEETDYLFSLAREYDLRFLVMADRYDYPGKIRSIEDIKWRYYTTCRRLIRNRPWAGDDTSKNQLLAAYNFDKDHEELRKTYLIGLYDRTPEQIAEEEALYVEIKRLEQVERRFSKERDDLLRTLGGIESGLMGLRVDPDAATGLPLDPKRKKKKGDGSEMESPLSAILPLAGPSQPKRKESVKQPSNDALHCMIRLDPSSIVPSTNKSSHTPVYLRSTRLPAPKANIATKVAGVLAELKISSTRLVMPTQANLERLEALQTAAVGLVDIKRAVDRVEQDIRMMKARLRGSEPLDGQSMDETGVPGVLMIPEDTSRKRSVSVSSTGTAATTRTSTNKRRKR